jgi:hypothetical protein
VKAAVKIRATTCSECPREIVQPRTGRPRETCSERCRQNRRRRRAAVPWPPVAQPGYPADPRVVDRRTAEALVAMLEGRPPAPPIDQLAQGLLEVDWIVYRLAALERDLPRRLAARAGELANAIRRARRRLFPEE